MKKILIATALSGFNDEFWSPVVEKKLREYGFEIEHFFRPGLTLADLPADPDVEAVVTSWGSPRFTAEVFEKLPNLKFLGHCAGSAAAVASPEFYEKGGRIFSANYIMATAVAEWDLLMTLLHSRNFFCSGSVRSGELMDWEQKFNMGNLRESVIGCWGFGDITRHFLRMLKPLNIGKILVASKHADAAELAEYGAEKVAFADLFKESDMIHCLVGVTPDTWHGIGAKELAALKDGAAIINGGRAGLIDEEALCRELASRRLYAYLDVFYEEPLPADSPLYIMPNLVMTPHNAGYPGRKEFLPFLLDEFNRAAKGEKCLCEISADRLRTMTVEQLGKKK
jgi:phosphoglycerate dehydrogenase-like enzyme